MNKTKQVIKNPKYTTGVNNVMEQIVKDNQPQEYKYDLTDSVEKHQDTKQSWEIEFDRRFGIDDDWDSQLYHYVPSGLIIATDSVKEFIRPLLAKQRQELEAYQGKQKRIWYQKGYQEAKRDLKEQVLKAVGEYEKISEESVETIDGSYDVTEDLSTTRNELRAEIKKRIEAVFEKESESRY